jgi:hypothetical protein
MSKTIEGNTARETPAVKYKKIEGIQYNILKKGPINLTKKNTWKWNLTRLGVSEYMGHEFKRAKVWKTTSRESKASNMPLSWRIPFSAGVVILQ